MKWIRVIDELPVIPKGKYGVRVLCAIFDPCYDEINDGKGYSVHALSYGIVCYKNMPMFKDSAFEDGEHTFMELWDDNTFGYTLDPITHWCYMPEPPEYDPEVLNPIFEWYHEHSVPQIPLKQLPVDKCQHKWYEVGKGDNATGRRCELCKKQEWY